MHVSISYENVNLLLLVIGIALIIHLITIKRGKRRAVKFSNFELLREVVGEGVYSRELLPLLLRICVLVLIIFAISNFTVTFTTKVTDTDFVITLDTSSSMLMPDIAPNRLEAAKEAAVNLVKVAPHGTKIGVVSFSGEARVEQELTDDKEKLVEKIKNISIGTKAGTAIGDALIVSSIVLQDAKRRKSIILITDGECNVGTPLDDALEYVKRQNITVYAIGVGRETNFTTFNITIPKEYANFTMAKFQELNETALILLANQTNGKYFRARNFAELKRVYEDAVLRTDIISIKPIYYLLVLAAILLLIEWALGITKYRTIP
jgi:Ca-activated chloride channel family protein